MEDGGHGPRMSTEWYMDITTHWGGAGDSGIRCDQGVYCPSPEHGCTIYFELSYHRLVSGSGSEARNATLAELLGAARSEYPRDKSGACSSGDGGGDGDGGIGGRERVR